MKKHHFLIIVPIFIGVACFISFELIGSEVAPDGTLIEPFALIPIGYLFLFIGIITQVIKSIKWVIRKR